jgi:hypothetical protein
LGTQRLILQEAGGAVRGSNTEFIEHFYDILQAAAARQLVSVEASIAFGLLTHLGSEGAFKLGWEGVQRMFGADLSQTDRVQEAIRTLCDHSCRIAPLESRKNLIDFLLAEASARPELLTSEVTKLRELVAACELPQEDEALPQRATIDTKADSKRDDGNANVDWTSLVGRHRYTSANDFEDALCFLGQQAKGSSEWNLKERLHQEFFTRLLALTVPVEYIFQLNAILDVNADVLSYDTMLAAISERLESWKYHPLVREWRVHMPRRIAQKRFDVFFFGEGFSRYQMNKLNETFAIPKQVIVQDLVRELPNHVRDLGAGAIYDVVAMLVGTLTSDESGTVLNWLLLELKSRLSRPGIVTIGIGTCDVGLDHAAIETTILWYLFGHPDRRVRWRAVHSARRFVKLGRKEILSRLANLYTNNSSPLTTPGTAFYQMSAQNSFLLLLDRLSTEAAGTVSPLAGFLFKEATSPSTPHAMNTFQAKTAALRLSRAFPRLYSKDMLRQLKSVLQVQTLPKEVKVPVPEIDNFRTGHRGKFHFDFVDTIPYWYKPLGERFGVSAELICRMAERWICDRWGFGDGIRESDPIRQWGRNDREWRLRDHRHGSQPTIEDLQTYLELNAMFCVASELATTHKVVPSRWDDDGDRWESWLDSWGLTWKDDWLADRRGVTPFEPELWERGKYESAETWQLALSETDCDAAADVCGRRRPQFILAYANETRYRYDQSEHVTIHTALVSALTARSLLHALNETANPFDYRIPDEGDRLEIDENEGSIRFSLKGWTSDRNAGNEGFDLSDPLRNQLGTTLIAPGPTFVKSLNLVFDQRGYNTYRQQDRSLPVTCFECWNDVPREEEHHSFATEGKRLWVNRDAALTYLSDSEQAIIVMCIIDRRTRRDWDSEEKAHGRKTKLYVIHKDGTIESASRDHRAGEPNH